MDFQKKVSNKITKGWSFLNKHKWYSLSGLAILAIIIYFSAGSSTTGTSVQKTYVVKTGTIENSIKVLGDTKITNQQTLTFAYEGTVKALYIKEGDAVKKGQLLAEIDKSDLQKNIAQQSLSLENTRINYDKTLKQYSEADKLKAQQNIDETLLKLSLAKKDLQDMSANKKDSFATTDTLVQSIIIGSKGMIIDIKSISESMDEIFNFTNRISYEYKNVAYCISEIIPSEKTNAENYFKGVTEKIKNMEKDMKNIEGVSTVSSQSLKDFENTGKDLINTFSSMLEHSLKAVKNSSLCGDLKQSTLDNRSSTINNGSSKALSYLSTINNNLKSIDTNQVDILNKGNEIKNYEVQLATYKEALNDMNLGMTYEDKTIQENNIRQAEISLSKLTEQTKDYELRAPFDGNVDMITFKVGDNIANDNISSEGITISNPNFYEIKTLIDQVDIVKIEKGQIANISFDAYPGYTVTGEISNIDPTPTVNAGVVSYTAIINMEKGEKKIYDSMTVNLEIITESKDDIIVVPTTAIQTRGNKSFVQIEKNGQKIIKPVEIGIKDTFNTEIKNGLEVGQTVLLNEYETTSSTKLKSPSGFPAENAGSSMRGLGIGGGGGGGFPRN